MRSHALIAGVVLAAIAQPVHATLFYSEPFNYPNGNLVNGSNGPNTPAPPFWEGTFASISGQPSARAKVNTGMLELFGSATPAYEQPYLTAGTALQQGQTWFAGFHIFLPTAPGFSVAPHTVANFFQNRQQQTHSFFVRASPSSNAPLHYIAGLTISTGNGVLEWPTPLEFETWHRIVMSYTLDPDNTPGTSDSILKLWIDPVDESSPSLMTTSNPSYSVNSFLFDHGNGVPNKFVDNLNLATTFAEAVPEPSTFALLAIGAVGMCLHRKRRQR